MTCILTQFNKISKTMYKTKEELISLLTTDICYLYDTILLTEIDDFLNILLEDDTENGQDNLNEITNILVSRLKHIIKRIPRKSRDCNFTPLASGVCVVLPRPPAHHEVK